MNTLVFDSQNDARDLWQTVLREFDICVAFAETFTREVFNPRESPRILIFDQSVIGNKLETAIQICNQSNLDIAVITGSEISFASAVRLMKSGASWVFAKSLDIQQVREAMPQIQESAEKLREQIAELCSLQALMSNISPREQSVLELVLDGVPNKQIAKQLEVSIRTVESRRARIYQKCEVNTVTELVRCVDRAQELRSRYGDCPREKSGVGKQARRM